LEKNVIFCQISKLNKANFGIIYIQDVTQRKIRKQILSGKFISVWPNPDLANYYPKPVVKDQVLFKSHFERYIILEKTIQHKIL